MRRSLIGLLGLAAGSFAADAQTVDTLEYPVKIVCDSPTRLVVAHGYYFTAINIYNAGVDTAIIQHSIALTDTGETAGPVIAWPAKRLAPGRALEIDCTTMPPKIVRLRPPFRKGFAIIQSSQPLDVVAVYTAAARRDSPISVLEIERVPGRGIVVTRPPNPDCPDLVIDSISKPVLITAAGATVVTVYVHNIGSGTAGTSMTRLQDLTTVISGLPPYQVDIVTSPILGGMPRAVPFGMPYLPRAGVRLQATADVKNQVSECREDNNIKQYIVP